MDTDFQVGNAGELVKGDKAFDLHNCFDFCGISVDGASSLRICFAPNVHHGHGLKAVVVEVHELTFLELSESFGVTLLSDLDEIGYKRPGDKDLDWLMSQDQAASNDHLVFRFSPKDFVRVHGRSARLVELESGTCMCLAR